MQTAPWFRLVAKRTVDPVLAFTAAVLGGTPAAQGMLGGTFHGVRSLIAQPWFASFFGTLLGLSAFGLLAALRRWRVHISFDERGGDDPPPSAS